MSEAILIAIIAAAVGLGTAMPGIIKAMRDSNRDDDEHRLAEMSAVTLLLEPLKSELNEVRQRLNQESKQVEKYRREIHDLSNRMSELQSGLERLIFQLQSHNIDPVWKPRIDGE